MNAGGVRSWRRYRLDYGLLAGSGLLAVIGIAAAINNFRTCAGFVEALSGTLGEFVMLLYTFGLFVFPMVALLIAFGGFLGFVVRVPRAIALAVVAMFAIGGGAFLARLPDHVICGGGPYF